MKINILSPSRFHVCDLARELARNGHDVKFYSFVPTKRAMKFGLPKECSASLFWPMSPLLALSKKFFPKSQWAAKLTILFQDWLTSVVMRKCDVCIAMSGSFVAAPRKAKKQGAIVIIERGSKHIMEQKRIVKELGEWLSIIDKIEESKGRIQKVISLAKSKVLDLAIHGKLVPQDPTDEPATELLKRINPKAEITCDNGHYQKLPEGWCETQLGDIFNHNTGKALNSSNTEGTLKDYLTTSNVYWNSFDFSVIKKMLFKESELNKCQITKGDLLVCEGGDIGRAAIWDYDYDICIQNHLHRLRPKVNGLCVSFYNYVLYYLKINNMIGGKGIGLLGLSSNALHKLHVPFPSLNEQHRIVSKIEEIFAQLDAIEALL